jgi:hypothetical protein
MPSLHIFNLLFQESAHASALSTLKEEGRLALAAKDARIAELSADVANGSRRERELNMRIDTCEVCSATLCD